MMTGHYPRIVELGIPIHVEPSKFAYVSWTELNVALLRRFGEDGAAAFGKLFGCQTCPTDGAYPWDVEAVLERMMSGKLTGTQLVWD